MEDLENEDPQESLPEPARDEATNSKKSSRARQTPKSAATANDSVTENNTSVRRSARKSKGASVIEEADQSSLKKPTRRTRHSLPESDDSFVSLSSSRRSRRGSKK